jgi:pSer/pThr/pTyr-binding forkhead associated (FHA) protein
MKSFLTSLEKKIQAIVEGPSRLFSGHSKNSIESLVLVEIQQILLKIINQGGDLPNVYSIHVNPFDHELIMRDQNCFDQWKKAIIEVAEENKKNFIGPLSIELIPDDEIDRQKFVLSSFVIPSVIEQTSAIKTGIKEENNIASSDNMAYLILPNQKIYPLNHGIVQIGRRKDNHLVIDLPTISRNHAQIRKIQGKFVIIDLNSTSGTIVNGIRVSQMTLFPGDVISFAGYTIIYGEEVLEERKDQEKTSELPKTVSQS